MRIGLFSATSALLFAAGMAAAGDGTWAVGQGGSWDATGNWIDGIVANGADYTAYFTPSITGNTRVTIANARTIGHLEFSDDGTADNRWLLSGGTLTLSAPSGTPTVTTITVTTLSSSLAGNQGFRKLGGEQLTLTTSGSNEALSGDIRIESGSVIFSWGNILGDDATLIVQGGRWVYFVNEDETFGGLAGSGNVEIDDGARITVGAGNQTTEFSGYLTEYGTGGSLAKTGTGTLTLSGSNDYSGGTTLYDGAISVSAEINLGNTAGGLTFDGGTLGITGSSFASTSRTIAWGAGGGGFSIAEPNHTFTVSQNLSGGGDLTKTGAGALSLTGSNEPYAGTIHVDEGSLRVGINNSLGTQTHIDLAPGTVLFIDSDEEWGSLAGAGDVDLGPYYIAVGHDGTDATLSGTITGAGIFKKVGAGSVTLTGANDYSGGTVVAGGTLLLRGDNSAMTGTIHVLGGCSLFAGLSNSLSEQIRVDLDADATLVIEEGEYWGSLVGSGHVDLGAHTVLVGQDDTDAVFSGDIAGTGTFLKGGGGALTLSGASTHSGGTSVTGGVLIADHDAALGAGGVTVDGGTLGVGDGAGTLGVGGSYSQGSTGGLRIEIGGVTPASGHDQLNVTGTASLAGMLEITLINGYGWERGSSYVILTAGAVTGTFDTTTGPGAFDVIYNADNVTIVPVCSVGDIDCDADVDLVDLDALAGCLSGPGSVPPGGCDGADLDEDEDVDLADYAGFQSAFTEQ